MRIYEIIRDPKSGNTARLKGLPAAMSVYDEQIPALQFAPDTLEAVVDYPEQDHPVVSGEMWELLKKYSPGLIGRQIFVGCPKSGNQSYWLIKAKYLRALHPETTVDNNGFPVDLVFDREVIRWYPIFSVVGLKMNRWFVSLEVVEGLLRYGMTGFTIREVRVDG